MNNSINIRLAHQSELPKIAFLDRQVNKTFWSMIQYEESLVNPNEQIYVLEINRTICGLLVISIVYDEMEILQLAIARHYQNQQLATLFLSTILTRLGDKHSISKVFLEVCSDNLPALAVYKKLGFNQITVRKNYYEIDGARFDARVMMLDYAKS